MKKETTNIAVKTIPFWVALIFAPHTYGHDANHEMNLPNVMVKEEKIKPLPSATTTEIDEARLIQLRPHTNDTAKLLDGEPGVSLYQAGGVSSMPVIRGFADDRIRIKVDGMDLISACANHMNTPLSYIDPANVSSIKVYAGVTPVSIGGDSIGGTIKVESAAPKFSKVGEGLLHEGSISAFYRSNNDARGANFSATIASESFSARYTGSTVEANNYRAGGSFKAAGPAAFGRGWLSADEVGSTAYKAENHAMAFALKNDNHLFEFKVGVQNIPYQGFANQRMDLTDNNSQQYNFKYTGQYDWGNLQANVYHERTRHSMNFGRDKQYWYGTAHDIPGMPMETQGRNTGGSIKADFILSERDNLKVGTEIQRYRLDDYWPASQSISAIGTNTMMGPNSFQNINNGQRDRYDVFAEWDAKWNQSWMSQVGLRHSTVKMDTDNVRGYNDCTFTTMMGNCSLSPGGMNMPGYGPAAAAFNGLNHKKTDQNLDFTALARFTPDETKIFEAGYSVKNRSPNLYERYTWSNSNSMVMNMNNWVGDGNGYVGNLNLKPETAHTLSLSGEWHDAQHEQWNVRVSPYYSYVDNYIDAIPSTTSRISMGSTDGFANLSLDNQSARLYGMDISSHVLLGSLSNLGSFRAMGVVNYVRGKNKDTGDDLYNIMPLNAKFAFEQRLGGWTNVAELKMVSAKDSVQAIRREVETSGYSIVNLYSSYDWSKVRFDFGIENVFDKLYYHPLSGAYLGQGATMSSNASAPQHGAIVPAMGRSINIGLTLKF
jgi:iron complex outermembrane receptor protein